MLGKLPPLLVGIIASVLMVLNALFWVPILLFVSLIKLLLPGDRKFRHPLSRP